MLSVFVMVLSLRLRFGLLLVIRLPVLVVRGGGVVFRTLGVLIALRLPIGFPVHSNSGILRRRRGRRRQRSPRVSTGPARGRPCRNAGNREPLRIPRSHRRLFCPGGYLCWWRLRRNPSPGLFREGRLPLHRGCLAQERCGRLL